MDPVGKPFGNARLLEAIGQGGPNRSRRVLLSSGEIARWCGTERPQDDISILAVEVSVAWKLGKPQEEKPSPTVAAIKK